MEKILMQILDEIKGIKGDINSLTGRVDSLTTEVTGLKRDVSEIKERTERMEQKLDIVHQQTGKLTEIATENEIFKIKTDQKIKKHDIEIEIIKKAVAN